MLLVLLLLISKLWTCIFKIQLQPIWSYPQCWDRTESHLGYPQLGAEMIPQKIHSYPHAKISFLPPTEKYKSCNFLKWIWSMVVSYSLGDTFTIGAINCDTTSMVGTRAYILLLSFMGAMGTGGSISVISSIYLLIWKFNICCYKLIDTAINSSGSLLLLEEDYDLTVEWLIRIAPSTGE